MEIRKKYVFNTLLRGLLREVPRKIAPSKIQKKYWGNFCNAALQINIPLPVIMNRKIKKPPVKLKFWWSQ